MAVESFDASDVTSVDDLKGFRPVESGQYHVVVVEVDESREKLDAVVVKLGILAGTTKGQENRSCRINFNDPKPSHKDGGAFVKKRRLALFMATGMITPDMLGKPFNVDWQHLLNRQFKCVIKAEEREGKDDPTKKYTNHDIDGLSMWGPLDDDARHIPHDDACIEAAVRAGQVNVVSKYRGPAAASPAAIVASAAPAASVPATTGLPPAVDRYAGL